MYDNTIGRWFSPDRLADYYYPYSPYVYATGNPMLLVDINGDYISFYEIAAYQDRLSYFARGTINNDMMRLIGTFEVSPYLDPEGNIMGWSAFRDGRIQFVMDDPDDIHMFETQLANLTFAADLFYMNGEPSEGMIAMLAGDTWKGLGIQWIEALSDPGYYFYVANISAAAAMNLPQNNSMKMGMQVARQQYPHKAYKFEYHHIEPKYMGGAIKGPTVRIEASYHQVITNEFRKYHPYGGGYLSPAERQAIMNKVYQKYPLR